MICFYRYTNDKETDWWSFQCLRPLGIWAQEIWSNLTKYYMPVTLVKLHDDVYGLLGIRAWSFKIMQNTAFKTYFTNLKKIKCRGQARLEGQAY